ncbi:MAG: Hpt domain-containing protein [Xanthobacteraceae bacterium]|nr:Hpt domain-containing protein [Xanthobacteraceae bacterium]
MQPLLEQVPWMCSPPLVPDHSVIDLEHLRRMTLGEPDLERQVLEMFRAQTGELLIRLKTMPADAAALAHTLKGSSRAIGAFEVGNAAQGLETALRTKSDIAEAMQALLSAVGDAHAAIAAILGDIKP